MFIRAAPRSVKLLTASLIAAAIGWSLASPRAQRLALFAPALADTSAPQSSATPAATVDAESVPLPELPELQPIRHPAPAAAALKDVEGRLSQLLDTTIDDPLDEATDLSFLTEDLGPDAVPAIAQRIQELRGARSGGKAEKALEAARKNGRSALRKAGKGRKARKGAPEASGEGDWLRFVLALGRNRDEAWRDLTELYGMLRMLEAVGDTPAMREMVACYSYFGELVRIDLQRSIGRLKDKAVPALIEARKHDARRVRRWAARQLDNLGRAIPGEAVSTTDPEVLADVLRAFGRTRDVDAVRVVLSFCNSERAGLREAAREAIGAIGEPAQWQLRDGYQSLTGEKAPRSWSWQRTAQELFRLHDAARLAVVYRQMADGLEALRAERHRDAAAAFDKVLARNPLFERRSEMAPAYAGLASELESEGKRDEAMTALRKALRLASDGPGAAKAKSRLATLEGEALIEAGTPDRFLLKRALELDPQNDKARQLLASLEDKSVRRQHRSQRYLAAVIVGVIATIAMVLLARRRPRSPKGKAKPHAPPDGPSAGESVDEAPEPRPLEPSSASPPPESDERPTAPIVEAVQSDALPTREIDPPPDTEDAPTQELASPPDSDRMATRPLDEPPEDNGSER